MATSRVPTTDVLLESDSGPFAIYVIIRDLLNSFIQKIIVAYQIVIIVSDLDLREISAGHWIER